jgi:hypothetical protein
MRPVSKAIRRLLIAGCCLAPLGLLSSCQKTTSASTVSDKIRLSIADSPYFTPSQKSFEVSRGTDVVITLSFEAGYVFESCSYASFSVADAGFKNVQLLLKKVSFPELITITAKKADYGIMYQLNGGSFLSADFTGTFYAEWPTLAHHKRANTSLGTRMIERKGYVLTGWNTKEDLTGERIGLGSRVTMTTPILNLYADWKKETDPNDFTYAQGKHGLTITSYTGTQDVTELVIPRYQGSDPITAISNGSFKNLTKLTSLYLSEKLISLESNAFSGSPLTDITFCDTLLFVDDNSFSVPIKNWHLNACLYPRYQSGNDNAEFADDMDRLILAKDQQKMIFFAGCSMSYGLKSEEVSKVYGSQYTILDMGVIGGTNASFQFDCITPYLKSGDVFIHAPEVGSPYQLLDNIEAELRVFVMTEGNFDLLSLTDMTAMTHPFQVFSQFALSRFALPGGSYEDYLTTYNDYGDISIARPYTGVNKSYTDGKYTYQPSYVNSTSMTRLAAKYDQLKAKGATVYFSYSPVNSAVMDTTDYQNAPWETFATKITEAMAKYSYPVISTVTDYLYDGTYFYDEDYHLNDKGAQLRTEQLIYDLKKVVPV